LARFLWEGFTFFKKGGYIFILLLVDQIAVDLCAIAIRFLWSSAMAMGIIEVSDKTHR